MSAKRAIREVARAVQAAELSVTRSTLRKGARLTFRKLAQDAAPAQAAIVSV